MSLSNQKQEKRTITDRNKVIGFGRYAKETVQEILDVDPAYFIWLDSNTDIEIACDILTEAQDNMQPDHEFKNWTKRDVERSVGSLNDFIGD